MLWRGILLYTIKFGSPKPSAVIGYLSLVITYRITMEYEYITSGAMLRCDKGGAPCQLYIAPRSPTIGGQPWANENDKDPLLNKLNFGVCTLTQKPCLATIRPLRWFDVKRDVEVAGALALLSCSKLPCALGGFISLEQSGQLV